MASSCFCMCHSACNEVTWMWLQFSVPWTMTSSCLLIHMLKVDCCQLPHMRQLWSFQGFLFRLHIAANQMQPFDYSIGNGESYVNSDGACSGMSVIWTSVVRTRRSTKRPPQVYIVFSFRFWYGFMFVTMYIIIYKMAALTYLGLSSSNSLFLCFRIQQIKRI